MQAEQLDDYKRRFARAWLQDPKEPFKAALTVFGSDTGSALRASSEWLIDPVVLEEKEKVLAEAKEGNLDFLPDKAEAARLAWDIAANFGEVEDRLKALKLYADIRGFIQKPDTQTNVNLTLAPKVMVMKDHGTDEDWEAKALAQQAQLTQQASGNAETKH